MPLIPSVGARTYGLSRGEAVIVDLGKRGTLFALLQNVYGGVGYSYRVALQSFPDKEATPIGTKVVLPTTRYPKLVRFKEITNPATVESILEPANKCCEIGINHLEDFFGKGVRIKEISIEITNDEVTTDIKKKLPWLSSIKCEKNDCVKIRNPFPSKSGLTFTDFVKGQ